MWKRVSYSSKETRGVAPYKLFARSYLLITDLLVNIDFPWFEYFIIIINIEVHYGFGWNLYTATQLGRQMQAQKRISNSVPFLWNPGGNSLFSAFCC